MPLIIVTVVTIAGNLPAATGKPPIGLHPANSHYFLWRDKPTILITSAEHYGAVLNRVFDYTKYLDTLTANNFNLTRTFSGAYCEPVGAFNIENNTLAPAAGNLLCPWARSDVPGYVNGGNKFDLTRWNPAYFDRLRAFVAAAGQRGIVVELVLFCPFYKDSMWDLSPMNAENNVNGIGHMERTEVYTLKDRALLAAQDAMVRKVVAELRDFDNLYYEICNEPYFGGVTIEWQRHVAETIARAESGFEYKHLIAQNIANKSKVVENPSPHVSILNFHYAKPPEAVAQNYHWDRVIGDDETGFSGDDRVKPYRLEGWDFIMAGGAIYSNLDYSFAVGHEDGTNKINAPGGGGSELWKQLRILTDFINGFDFIAMRPDNSILTTEAPEGTTARALVEPGRAYAIYVRGSNLRTLSIALPSGTYQAEWIDTKTGEIAKTESFTHESGSHQLTVPSYADDIALRIAGEKNRKRQGLLFESDFEGRELTGWKISGNAPTIDRSIARPASRR